MYISKPFPRDNSGKLFVDLLNKQVSAGYEYVETVSPNPNRPHQGQQCVFKLVDADLAEKALKDANPLILVAEKPAAEQEAPDGVPEAPEAEKAPEKVAPAKPAKKTTRRRTSAGKGK